MITYLKRQKSGKCQGKSHPGS